MDCYSYRELLVAADFIASRKGDAVVCFGLFWAHAAGFSVLISKLPETSNVPEFVPLKKMCLPVSSTYSICVLKAFFFYSCLVE